MKKIFPSSFYNPITLIGAAVAVVNFGLILFLTLLEALAREQKPYMGIITFIILPGFLIIGLILIAIGIIREHRRERHGKKRHEKFPIIDLNNPSHRSAVTFFSVGTILLLLFSAFGSFKAYEYTDSVQFCGTVCHSVMNPEYTAYQYSPHARVDCVKCHIGPGATWYVRSKLSGAYQVYATIFNLYPRPIPTPISNLRPARETCEQCHWPNVFYNQKKIVNTYYLSDKDNSKMVITLLLKIGGGNEATGVTSGIHWHMNISNQITYIATDSSRQVIPWVKAKSLLTGKETIFKSTETKLTDEQLTKGEERVMDCIDCHNRPSHIYHPPSQSVNEDMAGGLIDPELPYIKSVSIDALEGSYSNKPVALDSIKFVVEDFYKTRYPHIDSIKNKDIEKSIVQLQGIYQRNYFPEMDVSWKKYPNNIGHLYSEGCFRCHDGKHVSEDGRVITKDCNSCHTILAEQFGDNQPNVSLTGLTYKHPVDIGNSWQETACSDCHSSN